MRLRNSLLAALTALATFGAAAVHAQDHVQDHVYVSVETNLPGALVYADAAFVGPVSAGVLAVPAGAAEVRLLAPERDTWSLPPVAAPLTAAAGDTVTLKMDFPYHYRIDSMPFGATVHLETEQGWQRLGETPLVYAAPAPLKGRLVVEEDGYVIQRLVPGGEVWNAYSLSLSPEPEADPDAARVAWSPPRRHRAWIDYAAVGTALVAGAVAVHYKFKADRVYDRYVETTDPALRPRFVRYDTYSGVALGTMQVSLGIFAVRLVLR